MKDKFFYLKKGIKSDTDSYSAFWDNKKAGKTELEEKLKDLGITHVFVCGLAWDFCAG